MSLWNNFYRLDTLDIGFNNNVSAQKATIYGNGKNQVEFYITVKIVDKDNNPIDISDKELIENIYLVRYTDGDANLGTWKATSKKNDYAKEVAWDIQPNDTQVKVYSGEKKIKCYLSASEGGRSIDISAAIHIPGVGIFDTSENGTDTRNGPKGERGTPFRNPKSKHVNSILAIDYSQPEEVEVKNMPISKDQFQTIASDMRVESSPTTPKYIGISSKSSFTIHPKKKGYLFQLGDPRRNNLRMDNCRFPGDIRPDMILGIGGTNEFDAQFIFVNRTKYGIDRDSRIFIETENNSAEWVYVIGPNDGRHYWSQSLEYGHITVNICNHRIPWGYMRKKHWDQQGTTILIDVTDNYGNSGVIKIKGTGYREHWPQVFINDDSK